MCYFEPQVTAIHYNRFDLGCLCSSFYSFFQSCSSSPSPDPKKTEGVAEIAATAGGNDVLAGIPTSGAGADPSPDLPEVTVAAAGISSGQVVPSTDSGAVAIVASQAPVLGAAASTTEVIVAPKPRALKVKKSTTKKSTL